MTAQALDTVFYQGERTYTTSSPLAGFARDNPNFPPFVVLCSGNWNGYSPSWLIRAEKLYLLSVDGFLECEGGTRNATLADIFPGCQDMRLADWYSGAMDIPRGEIIKRAFNYAPPVHEQTARLHIQNGLVTHIEMIDNREQVPQAPATPPDRIHFPMTAEGHGAYEDAWASWRRRKVLLQSIPMAAIESHRAAMALASANGWIED